MDRHTLGPRRAALTMAVVLLLFAAACGGTGGGDDVDQGSEGTRELPQGDGRTTTTLDPTLNFVAESIVQPEQPVYQAPGVPEPFTTLSNPRPVGDGSASVPLVMLVKADLGEWLEVYLPIRPNGSTGFVRASDVELTSHNWRIEVRLDDFNLKVFQGDAIFLDAPIGVAEDNTPTPGGLYYTTELIQPPDQNGPYGHYAYGLSGYSEVLQSFNGGPGQLGIHGTNQPDAIGTKVSHGCIRLRNDDIDKLAPVLPLGVPVEVIAGTSTDTTAAPA